MDHKAFSISWKDFPSHLGSTFQDLSKEGNFVDVTLVSDDQVQIQAHRLVISAGSQVLRTILLNNPHSHPLIYLKGIKQQELKSILQFMYLGEATIHQDRINEFMESAKDLEVKDLIQDAESENKMNTWQGQTITPETIDEHLTTAANHVIQTDKEITQREDISDKIVIKSSKLKETSKPYEYSSSHSFAMKTHRLNKHEGVGYSCNECDSDIKYTDKTGLRRHQLLKHECVRYGCDQCDYYATCVDTLKSHLALGHENGQKYSCDQCDFQGETWLQVQFHQQAKHIYLAKALILEDGINEFKENENELKVKDAAQTIITPSVLDVQLKLVTDIDDSQKAENGAPMASEKLENIVDIKGSRFTESSKPHSCDKCEYSSNHSGDLKKHKLNKHEGVSYPCSECDMKYADKTGLRRHLIQKHEGVKYGCDHCDYSATRVETLKNHVAIRHDYGQQNYFCKQCDYQGKTRRQVQSHQRKKHTDFKYSCNDCLFTSKSREYLQIHQMSSH